MASNMRLVQFCEIDLNDPFFDSLKDDYREFESWFYRKDNEQAWLFTGCREGPYI